MPRIWFPVLLVLSVLLHTAAHAADPLRLVVPFAPGGPVDQVARIVAPALTAQLGRTVVIENRGGAGGTVGANFVATAPADGSVALLATAGYVMSAGAMPSLPYDPRRDLVPVVLLGEVQTMLVVRPSLGIHSIEELIQKARAGLPLSYGSTGVGSTMHIGAELFNMATGLHAVHVPYRGAAPALTDLIAGNIDMVNADIPVLLPYVRDRQVVPLVVYDTARAPQLPSVPTAEEVKLPQLRMSNWYGILVPAATPAAAKATLEAATLRSIATPEVASKLADAGLQHALGTEAFRTKLASEFDRWLPFLAQAGIRAE